MISIPLNNGSPNVLPFFDIQAQVENTTYTFQFRWNVRESAWYMDILNEAGDAVILAGEKLVANFPLALHLFNLPFTGKFFVVDTTGNGIDPGLNDLGDRVLLYYIPLSDFTG